MKRILFLMSDTGGGHRAAAEAIRAAILANHEAEIKLVDVFRHYSPFPLKYMPEFYPWLVNHSKSSWGVGYRLLDTSQSARSAARGLYLTMESRLKRMLREHPADVIVSVHSVITKPSMQALLSLETRPPYVVVVTDLVTTPMFWYDRRSDRTLVPTPTAFERGLKSGLHADQMRITGLPVHPDFVRQLQGRAEARAHLGWDPDLPALLIVGGGDGMGPIYRNARALDELGVDFQLAVVAGRNESLKEQLDATEWKHRVHVYGFTREMPQMMAGADVLITKAGPGTICEACIAGLPMILYDAIPGQEDGNVLFVTENGAGAFCPSPEEVSATAAQWLQDGSVKLEALSRAAQRVARPNAVWDIAEEIWRYAQMGPVENPRRNFLRELQADMADFARQLTQFD